MYFRFDRDSPRMSGNSARRSSASRSITTCAPVSASQADNVHCLGAYRRAGAQAWHHRHGHLARRALRYAPVILEEELTMLIGPAADGAVLEIGVLDVDGDDPVIIHAMRLRPKFYRFLG